MVGRGSGFDTYESQYHMVCILEYSGLLELCNRTIFTVYSLLGSIAMGTWR
jgi:hypothetical protein